VDNLPLVVVDNLLVMVDNLLVGVDILLLVVVGNLLVVDYLLLNSNVRMHQNHIVYNRKKHFLYKPFYINHISNYFYLLKPKDEYVHLFFCFHKIFYLNNLNIKSLDKNYIYILLDL